jgi:hypothetical protein
MKKPNARSISHNKDNKFIGGDSDISTHNYT